MSSWQLFIRHAHRATSDRDLDNGLSDKGFAQCDELVNYLRKNKYLAGLKKVYSSPKIRCIETASAVAQAGGLQVEIDQSLDEQGWGAGDEFKSRLEKFVESTKSLSGVIFCSHGDVLPFIAKIYGESGVEIKKGDLFVLENHKIGAINPIHSSGNSAG